MAKYLYYGGDATVNPLTLHQPHLFWGFSEGATQVEIVGAGLARHKRFNEN